MTKDVKTFPILKVFGKERQPRRASVPWNMLEPHRKQAMRNHNQTLERLAERGGLSEIECLLVLEDRNFSVCHNFRAEEERILNGDLDRLVEAWEAAQ
jgi:hypothetical protein